MPLDALRRLLGLETQAAPRPELAPLRALMETLDHLEPPRARHLARFAYLLGRVAHADQIVTLDETLAMEAIVAQQGGLDETQAALVVGLAKNAHLVFGATADYEVARDFARDASDAEKLALVRCLFHVAATDARIAVEEESEIHRIAGVLKIAPQDLLQLRLAYQAHLPGLSRTSPR